MNIESLIDYNSKYLISDIAVDKILVLYRCMVFEKNTDMAEKYFGRNIEALSDALNEDQVIVLHEIQDTHWDNLRFTANYGFKHGIYLFFSQFFNKCPSDGFQNLNSIFSKIYSDDFLIDTFQNNLLFSNLNEATKQLAVSVSEALDEKVHIVFRYSYYLGYNYAKSIIADNGDAISEEMLKNILDLKKEFGFADTSLYN